MLVKPIIQDGGNYQGYCDFKDCQYWNILYCIFQTKINTLVCLMCKQIFWTQSQLAVCLPQAYIHLQVSHTKIGALSYFRIITLYSFICLEICPKWNACHNAKRKIIFNPFSKFKNRVQYLCFLKTLRIFVVFKM